MTEASIQGLIIALGNVLVLCVGLRIGAGLERLRSDARRTAAPLKYSRAVEELIAAAEVLADRTRGTSYPSAPLPPTVGVPARQLYRLAEALRGVKVWRRERAAA